MHISKNSPTPKGLNVPVHVKMVLTSCCILYCHPLITFLNIFDPDQAWQIVGPDLDPKCLTLHGIPDFFFLILEKNKTTEDDKKESRLTSMQKISP